MQRECRFSAGKPRNGRVDDGRQDIRGAVVGSAPAHSRYLSKTDNDRGEIVRRFAAMMSQPAISKHLSFSRTRVGVAGERGQTSYG